MGELETRDRTIYTMFRAGKSMTELATKFSVSRQRISQIIARQAAAVPDEDARGVQRAILENMIDRLNTEVVYAPLPVAITPTGKPVYDDDGNPILDHRAFVLAVDTIRKLSAELRRMDGLDKPRATSLPEDVAMQRVREYLSQLPNAEIIEE